MKTTTKYTIIAFAIFITCAFIILATIMTGKGFQKCKQINVLCYNFEGYYSRGTITIITSKINSHEDFIKVANHEWGHRVYDYYLTKEDMRAYLQAYNKCGPQTEYVKTYKSKGMKVMEDFAESFSIYKGTERYTICKEKLDVLQKYG